MYIVPLASFAHDTRSGLDTAQTVCRHSFAPSCNRIMLLERIELFINVAKHHNLAKTAREMHVSASSVCQRLKSLENDFAVKLYTRNKYGIELTTAGRILLTAASDVLTRIERLKTVVKRDVLPVETLTVGGTHSPSARYLPMAVAAFQKMHPNVKVSFLTARGATLEKLVHSAEVDIALIQSPSKSNALHLEQFASDNLVFFAHPQHPLTRRKKVALSDLNKIPLIIRDGNRSTKRLLKQLESRGIKIKVGLRCISPDAVKAAVRRKMGVGVLFSDIIKDDVKRKYFATVKFPDAVTVAGTSYIAYSRKKSLSPAATEFLKLLQSMKASATKSVTIADENRESADHLVYADPNQ
ncbi:MAG TPA: LysR family transcriptional regulator [Candidatus Binatia bacterium]|nr:LysR family transcriptional regulator [Candidatus Binatia bacterium]